MSPLCYIISHKNNDDNKNRSFCHHFNKFLRNYTFRRYVGYKTQLFGVIMHTKKFEYYTSKSILAAFQKYCSKNENRVYYFC